ncbi:hypothetical protein I4U23_023292 [Adineta vaga]|nr:hypothetical protein I4U23_023292 [Adineta vaga]
MVNDGHFYNSECILLIRLLLNDQCEILLINIENKSIVIDLIKKMPNLRALTFQCQDDQWMESLSIEDETLRWLKHNLPFHCLVERDQNEMSNIRVWIR